MSQQPHSPLQSQAFSLEFPQSLGTYKEYADVQRMVDILADAGFPVQNTLIVGTDLRLIERVTGRKTWGRVILGGALSGMWMGLFVGLLFSMLSSNWLSTILSSVLLGAVFFTVWAVIGHAMSGGQRDFTSMTATVPMHYELLVEHRNVMDARRILTGAGVRLGDGAFGGSGYGDSAKNRPTGPGTQSPGTQSPGTQTPGAQSPGTRPLNSPSHGANGPMPARPNRPQYGQSAPESREPVEPAQGSMASGAARDGAHSFGDSPALKGDDAEAPKRPTFGLPSDPDSAHGTHGDDEPHPRG
ncbi:MULTISPECIES: general stress protein [Dermabacter]|uniref:general stress protein n=1 Tax=Dermabacter TaxID=36739 RepID=UPI00290FE572|nr:general stress protein [Dermabacter sp.]MCT1710056.1 hypothetical protein [Dermabacter hominis]MDU4923452.1 general stress protein [Dermabacter sp.]